jgi:hypothetical protein
MDKLIQSWDRFEEYPHNIVRHDWLSHKLRACSDRLKSQNERLFDGEHAAVDFLDFETMAKGKFCATERQG